MFRSPVLLNFHLNQSKDFLPVAVQNFFPYNTEAKNLKVLSVWVSLGRIQGFGQLLDIMSTSELRVKPWVDTTDSDVVLWALWRSSD